MPIVIPDPTNTSQVIATGDGQTGVADQSADLTVAIDADVQVVSVGADGLVVQIDPTSTVVQVEPVELTLILAPVESIIAIESSELSIIAGANEGFFGPQGPQGATGPTGPAGSGVDKHYAHFQSAPQAVWTVNHNLGKYPAVDVVDSANMVAVGDIEYQGVNTLIVRFSVAFGGIAYCN